ncbi:DUF6519 domain-containing protein [Rubrivirga sp.]|uniref:DUF6519 domain-containing protein n=1 Tax=Rubrivirga sp. TaxID=1885344 RepID=UPI003B5241AA
MKADLSRSTFDPARHVKRVPLQQGRVQTDADANEQQAVVFHRVETTAADLVGGCGGPISGAGFEITPDGDGLTILAGRYYVDGWLVENESDVAYDAQPHLPLDAGTLAALGLPATLADPAPGDYLAYLDVWERHRTALEMPEIREVALGGPDTATRTQVVWQVRLHPLDEDEPTDCASPVSSWETATAPSTGQLGARADVAAASDDPCVVEPGAGYRRLENQLYRVEVHLGGTRAATTVKWDRDNGTVVSRLEAQSPDQTEWTLESVGRDAVLRFAPGDWAEITDDARELHGVPGTLVRVVAVKGDTLTVDLDSPDSPLPEGATVDPSDFTDPKVRRWNGVLPPLNNQTYRDLEDGVQVRLRGRNGPDGVARRYRTGDYWTIPARTNTGAVEWPTDDDGWTFAEGVTRHYCRLAQVTVDGEGVAEVTDCRPLSPPVTELTSLFLVGGDGQEAMPGDELPLSLRVGVANGSHPVEGARVRFEVTSGQAEIAGSSGGAATPTVEAVTDADGRAEVFWTPTAAPLTVEATLLDAAGDPVHLPVRFGANPSTADAVAYTPADDCALGDDVATVQDALDALCRREGDACAVTIGPGPGWQGRARALIDAADSFHLCFQAGEYVLDGPIVIEDKEHVTVTGCGPATRFVIDQAETVFDVSACRSVRFAAFSGRARFAADGHAGQPAEHLNGVLTVVGCPAVAVERVAVECAGGIRRAATGITVRDSRSGREQGRGPRSVRIRGCDVGIGHRQTGILVVDVERAVIEDNHLYATERPADRTVFEILSADTHYRHVLGRAMIAQARASRRSGGTLDPTSETRSGFLKAGLTDDPVQVRTQMNGFHASFLTPSALHNLWPAFLEKNPMPGGDRSSSVVQHLNALRSRVLRGDIQDGSADELADWLRARVRQNPAVASQGITVAESVAPDAPPPSPDVRVLYNRVEGCQQGIHVGASRREFEESQPDVIDTVIVAGNTVAVTLSPETSRERHGVFVGNADHVTVQDNRVRVHRTDPGADWRIDGVRLHGHYGPMLLVRQNHVTGATVGVRVEPLGDRDAPQDRHWYVSDNVAPGASPTVLAPGQVRRERNYPL